MSVSNSLQSGQTTNSISFRQAVAVGSIAVAWGVFEPSGALSALASTVTGAVGSLVAYEIGDSVYKSYDKWCHRASKPIIIKENTPQYDKLFDGAFNRLKKHPNYEQFKKIEHLESDEKAYSYLKGLIREGYCFGSIVNLLPKLAQNPEASCSDLLNSLNLEDVFYSQLCHFMLGHFQQLLSRVERDAEMSRKKAAGFESFLAKLQGLPEPSKIEEDPHYAEEAADCDRFAASLKSTINNFQTFLVPWQEAPSEKFPVKNSPDPFRLNLEKILASENFPADKPITGRILIAEAPGQRPKKEYKGGHTIVFQCSPGRFRYYDPMKGTGFYEYGDKAEFYQAVTDQAADLPNCENPHVQLFILKQG